MLWFHVGGPVWETRLWFNKTQNNRLLWRVCIRLWLKDLKYIQMRQDLPFSSADVLSGKWLAAEPAFFPLVASKAAYVPGNNICEEKSKENSS